MISNILNIKYTALKNVPKEIDKFKYDVIV